MDNNYGSQAGKSNNTSARSGDGKSELANDFNDIKDSISKTATHAKENAADLLKVAQEHTEDFQEYVTDYVKANPVKSVGIALLAGFIFSALLRR